MRDDVRAGDFPAAPDHLLLLGDTSVTIQLLLEFASLLRFQ